MDLTGKTAIVTGGGRDIGRAISIKLAASGANVALNYYNSPDAANETLDIIKKNGGNGIAVKADLTKWNESDETLSNPDGGVKIPAGWLIERCGFKGKRNGDAGVHKNQALVLVNHGNATGEEVLELAKTIQETVAERFGIQLMPEVNIIK